MANPSIPQPPSPPCRWQRRRWSLPKWVLTVWVGVVGVASVASAQEYDETDVRQEYNVKGAFLYSFGRYAKWPDSVQPEGQSLVIGVIGDAPLDPILQKITSTKMIGGRRIEVRRLDVQANVEFCHILFIARSVDPERQQAILAGHRDNPVLSVGESPGFIEWGGVINFYLDSGSIRFELNVNAARQKQITLDAKLLRLARVRTDEP